MNDTLILNNNKYIISSTKILTTKKKLTTNFDKKYLNDAEVRARGEFKPHVFLAPFRHYRHLTFLHLPIAGKFAFVGLPHWPFLKPQALPVAIVTLSFPPWRCTTPQEASRCASPLYLDFAKKYFSRFYNLCCFSWQRRSPRLEMIMLAIATYSFCLAPLLSIARVVWKDWHKFKTYKLANNLTSRFKTLLQILFKCIPRCSHHLHNISKLSRNWLFLSQLVLIDFFWVVS